MRRKPRRARRLKYRSVLQRSKSEASYRSGLEVGYQEGLQTGYNSYESHFQGTSIIIPSFNQVGYLKSCIESIREKTVLPYEIIVVDNASADGSAQYLNQLNGQVRYRILSENYGFSGAVNMGLMMAKGTTILILNNDTLVTDNWLENMIICLNSDPEIGMVGPVTNYISGDQQIRVPYNDIEEMPEFARLNNISDRKRWQITDRLTGFCLLFRRELFEEIGFMDEGFEIGNFEDDDYNIRVRLLGYSLVIAHDSFIHHFGSVSMKALGDHFNEVNNRNMVFYMNKWNNPYVWIHQVKGEGSEQQQAVIRHASQGEAAFYPEGVAVRGTNEIVYWIENGTRRPIEGEWSSTIVRLPQINIRRWPIGELMSEEEAVNKWMVIHSSGSGFPLHGQVTNGLDGFSYYVEHGTKRKIITPAAAEAWGLNTRPDIPLTQEQLSALPEGLPLIPPVKLRQSL
ncbi:MAG: glycosyltransferase family 2 protein [Candidatus Pristimantibacillus sp.]